MARNPVSEEGLTRFDHLPAEEAVLAAWQNSGVNPVWHYRMQQIMRQQMPVLTRALDRLVHEGTR